MCEKNSRLSRYTEFATALRFKKFVKAAEILSGHCQGISPAILVEILTKAYVTSFYPQFNFTKLNNQHRQRQHKIQNAIARLKHE